MGNKSPAPPGAFVETDVNLIDEGRMRADLEEKLRKAYRDLLDYEDKTADTQAKAVVILKLELHRTKGSAEYFDIDYCVDAKIPAITRSTTVRDGNGKLLCQPAGSNGDTPDQQLFYDRAGRIIGGVDPETGEVHDKEIVGSIARKA